MQLSSALLNEIVGNSGDDGSLSIPPDERRKSARVALGCRARIFPLMEASASSGQPVLVQDISVHGIGMLSSEPLSRGDEFVVHLPTINSTFGNEPVQIQCAVRRCQPGGSGKTQFAVGATFELVLNRPLMYSVAPSSVADAVSDGTDSSADNSPDSFIAAAKPAEQWAAMPTSPAEQRFDEQIAEAIQHQRQSFANRISEWVLVRIFARILRSFIRVARKIGILPGIDLRSFKIRSRLAATRSRKTRSLKELASLGTPDTADEKLHAEKPTPPQTYAERSILTALDSASQYVAGNEDSLPPVSTAAPLTGLEKRVSLFAAPSLVQSTEAVSINLIAMPAETSLVEAPAPAPTVAAPIAADLPTVPAFELPEFAPPAPLIDVSLPKPPPPEVSLGPTDLLLQQLYLPAEPSEQSRSSKPRPGAAWRIRHRDTPSEPVQGRPRLGR